MPQISYGKFFFIPGSLKLVKYATTQKRSEVHISLLLTSCLDLAEEFRGSPLCIKGIPTAGFL